MRKRIEVRAAEVLLLGEHIGRNETCPVVLQWLGNSCRSIDVVSLVLHETLLAM